MKAFNFRLKTLMHLRESAREQCLKSYGNSIKEFNRLGESLKAREDQLQELQDYIKRKRSSGFYGQDEENHQRTVAISKDKIIELHGELQNAKKIQEAKRKLFLKADEEFKSLEKLKGMQKAEHSRKQQKKEENEIDDIIGSRFAYNLNSPLS